MVMAYIQFESARVKEAERKEKKQAREAILKKVVQTLVPYLESDCFCVNLTLREYMHLLVD